MAFFSTTQPRASFFDWRASFFATVRQAVGRRREINRVRRELHRLSDRDLADIGIARGDIDAVARQANNGI